MTTPDDLEHPSLLSCLHSVADEHGAAAALGPATVPVAWIGRTSTDDMQDPLCRCPANSPNLDPHCPTGSSSSPTSTT
jgi:hypothetical protein